MGKDAAPAGEKQRVQVLDDITISDLTATRNEYHFKTPVVVDYLKPLLKDERDLPMLCLLVNIFEIVVPSAMVVLAINIWQPPMSLLTRNLVGLGHVLIVLLLFQERFTLCIHFASHRSIFHNENLNQMMNWVLAPFFGMPCGMYKFHHTIMHHIENNHLLDTSSTEMFQRDSWAEFGKYWFRFVILIWPELPYYAIRTKRWSAFVNMVLGLSCWLGVVFVVSRIAAPLAALWVVIIPYFVAMSAMAFGNWSQHIFVNPEDFMSNGGLAYNCIDTKVNQTTFNDGYHLIHHINARMHWTEMPQHFVDSKDKFAGSLTFRGVHFFDVGILVMTKQLRKLAECYVHIGSKETAPTIDEVEQKLKSWLVPVPKEALEKAANEGKKAK